MAVRKFLAPLTSSTSGESALITGLMLAELWSAHLLALHIRLDARDIAPLAGEGLSGAMIEEMMQATERESGERASGVREMFLRAAASRGITVGEAMRGTRQTSASYAAVVGREEEVIAWQARLADLTIVAHPLAGEDVAAADALHAVLFDSGRPVLMAPLSPPRTIGTRIAIAWNGTAESASAIASALPWLKQAQAVRVLTSDEYQRRGPSAQALSDYLALHGIAVDIATFRSIDKSVGAGLLAAAGEFGADLMSMGAYSSSRLRQLILGGTTRHVLENAPIPVLMNR
jgi:nucleotide-binding universal stress UspA family protein